jgi:hypothetical protein
LMQKYEYLQNSRLQTSSLWHYRSMLENFPFAINCAKYGNDKVAINQFLKSLCPRYLIKNKTNS